MDVRRAAAADAGTIGRLLHDFNAEFGDPTPGAEAFAARVRELLEIDTAVLLAGEGPDGFALLRFRANLYSSAQEAYLAELYVVPPLRGRGIGRALMEAAFELARERGCDRMELTTSTDDEGAIALYEKLGFTGREGRPDGPVMLYYERDL